MISSYVGENAEFERQYLCGELEVELTPQVQIFIHDISYNNIMNFTQLKGRTVCRTMQLIACAILSHASWHYSLVW